MTITNHYLAELAGWHRVHYYDFVHADRPNVGVTMYQWVQDNVPADRWMSMNGDMWFKYGKEATWFALMWA